jgi:NAD-dependent deacetylase
VEDQIARTEKGEEKRGNGAHPTSEDERLGSMLPCSEPGFGRRKRGGVEPAVDVAVGHSLISVCGGEECLALRGALEDERGGLVDRWLERPEMTGRLVTQTDRRRVTVDGSPLVLAHSGDRNGAGAIPGRARCPPASTKQEAMATPLESAVEILRPAEQILVFSGAGLSTESGIPDFRGPDGLWTKVDPEDFNIARYVESRELRVRGWKMHVAGELWGARSAVEPNDGHKAIVRLHEAGRLAGVVTQNVDGLHYESGLSDDMVAELHGNVRHSHCLSCGAGWGTERVLQWVEAGEEDPSCPKCGGIVKTNTVMFGEMLPEEEVRQSSMFLAVSDAVLVVGSTVSVWPAAEVVMRAATQSKPIVIINKGATEADHIATVKIEAGIGDVLPDLVDGILA